MPVFEGTVYRSMKFRDQEKMKQLVERLKVKGAIHIEHSFASSSQVEFEAQKISEYKGRPVRYIMTSKTGRDIASGL